MIKDIITSRRELSKPSKNCSHQKIIDQVVQDLIDTANAHKGKCEGLAANQIGYKYRIFILVSPSGIIPFINPEVVCKLGGMKQGCEGCLSRPDSDPVKVRRHKEIKIRIPNSDGEPALFKFKGFAARVIQHELDHFDGRLI